MGFQDNLKLTKNDFKENQEIRDHIKILLNSALGKFNQKSHHISNKFITNSTEMEKLFQESGENILGFNDLDENICHVVLKTTGGVKQRKTSPTLLAFITAKSRILLHKSLIQLVEAGFVPYYCDTDSILFSGKKNKTPPIKFGLGFGTFKHELGERTKIREFTGYGRKNFFIRYEENDSNEQKILAKICGMTLSSKIAQDEFAKKAWEKNPKFTQVRNMFLSPFSASSPTIHSITHNNINIRCERKICEDSKIQQTLPWGYNKD